MRRFQYHIVTFTTAHRGFVYARNSADAWKVALIHTGVPEGNVLEGHVLTDEQVHERARATSRDCGPFAD